MGNKTFKACSWLDEDVDVRRFSVVLTDLMRRPKGKSGALQAT